jgi:hypothetical protein
MLVVASAVAVVIALAPMPYGYYRLLRLWFCGVSIYFASELRPPWSPPHVWFLGGLAVLYNPVLPVALGDKGLWTGVNIATVAYLAVVTRFRPPRA